MRKPHPLTGFVPARGKRAGVDFEDVVQADYAVERALAGDLQPLADRLRNAKTLLPEERALAANIIDGAYRVVAKPAHRQASAATAMQEKLMALDVMEQMHLVKNGRPVAEKDAVETVCEKWGKSEKTVRDAVKAHPGFFAGLKRRARPKKKRRVRAKK